MRDRNEPPSGAGTSPSGDRGVAFLIHGRVQGVAFRWHGRRAAEELGLRGWIRNRGDGGVEGEAFGDPAALERLLDRLREGPPAAEVESFDVRPIPTADVPTSFEIRH